VAATGPMTPSSPPREYRTIDVGARALRVSSIDKVLWPALGLTKRWLLGYYLHCAPAIVPHLRGHPLTLYRCTDGVEETGWYQTRAPAHPNWIRTTTMHFPSTGKTFDACVLDDDAALLWAANIGSVELHPFLGCTGALDRPTALVFDLDPGHPATIVDCAEVALELRDALDQLGLAAYPKTSGGHGLHVHVPVDEPVGYDATKPFAHALAQLLERRRPDLVVAKMGTRARKGKVFVDWSQNDPRKSTVAPYSLRAGVVPTVATPVEWFEVERAVERGDPGLLTFSAGDVLGRLERRGDLFAPALERRQTLPALT
jgi:bifunctional non-homologous end joining protein LigD